MLISFTVENFRSFACEQTFSMVASPDSTFGDTLVDAEGEDYRLLRAAGIYGANASGKSGLLKAILAASSFVVSSATGMNLGDDIPRMTPFRLDPVWREKPCRFAFSVLLNGSRYEYAFAASKDRVYSESLYVRKAGVGTRLTPKFLREYDPATKQTRWELKGFGKKDTALLTEKTRDNGLLLSRAAELNFKLVEDLFLWFKSGVWHMDLSSSPRFLVNRTAKRIQTDEAFRNRVLALVRDADFGISDISASEEPLLNDGWPDELRDMMHTLSKRLSAPLTQMAVRTTHLDSERKPVAFSLDEDESNGTQRFFALAGPILDSLDSGWTVFLDELECSMHPSLTRKIVELYRSPTANRRGAQLIFATHDSSLMDHALLRRDQLWIAAKRQSGATELFSLYDIEDKPRKDEPFQRNYLAGEYGGVPSFGPTLEDLEIQ